MFRGVLHADHRDQANACAINKALWPATWGSFLDRLTEPDSKGLNNAISDATEQAVRDFFNDHVYGRSPLPTLRVGDQPYGFLPVSRPAGDRWSINRNDPIDVKLSPLLQKLRSWWQLAKVPTIADAQDFDETFKDIMGTYPVSRALRTRAVVSSDTCEIAQDVGFNVNDTWDIEQQVSQVILGMIGIDHNNLHNLGSLSKKSFPLTFPLVHESDVTYIEQLLGGSAPKAKSVLQAMLKLSLDSAKQDVKGATPKIKIRKLIANIPELTAHQRTLILKLANNTSASAQRLHKETDRLLSSFQSTQRSRGGKKIVETGRIALKTYQPFFKYRTSYVDLLEDSSLTAAKEEFAIFGTIAWLRAKARLAEVREGIQELAKTDLLERTILVGEALDLSSHRLDAWLTGLVDKRRKQLRSKRPRGLTVGAFGWLENIKPGAGAKPDGGYIHAPSLDHAVTAGILRSAFLTHNPPNSGDSAFAIDLSSERVRTALHLVDGIQQGQPLGALLGYRIERALHEARLDRLILTLRRLAPLVAQRLTDRNEDTPPEALESIASNNVLDGIRLIEKYKKSWQARKEIREALNAPPADNPYITEGNWPGLSTPEWRKVEEIIRDADSANDAAADLLLSESVHQLVRGSTARSSAVLSAAGSGDLPPPDPEVIKTPNPGMPFMHRVLIIMDENESPWDVNRPRAIAEPAIEAWAAKMLGDPSSIILAADQEGKLFTFADTELCALDIIYDSGDRRLLEQRVRAALPEISIDTPLIINRESSWPDNHIAYGQCVELAVALRATLVGATPANPADFHRACDEITRTISNDALAELKARGTEVRGLLATALEELNDAIDLPMDSLPDADEVALALEDLAAFGAVQPGVEGENLLALAEVAAAEAEQRIAKADECLASENFDLEDVNSLSEALFGDGFWMLPQISPSPDGDLFSTTWGRITPPRAETRRFVRDVASVREALSRFSKTLLIGDA